MSVYSRWWAGKYSSPYTLQSKTDSMARCIGS
jgi:hypothetical protein